MNGREKGEVEERFLSYVSHKIRTPLNSVIGFSKLLQDREISEGKTKEFAGKILDSGYQILQYFQNLIDISELEAGMVKIHPSRFGLHHLLTGIVGGYKDRLETDKSVGIYLMNKKDDLFIHQDEFVMERVTTNLIELVRSKMKEGLMGMEYEETNDGNIKLEVKGMTHFDNGDVVEEEEPAGIVDKKEHDYLTWKTISRMIELIGGTISCRLKNKEIAYAVTFPKDL
jgi:K+-sensing histidine kinase KdpD